MVGAPGTVAGTNAFDAADAGPVPTALVAVTLHVYVLPLVSPEITIGLEAPEPLRATPPFDDVQLALKLVIALPPSLPGVKATDADPLPRVAVPMTGAAGTVTVSTTAFDAAEAGPVPLMFVAV